jgi:hypothetical protein
VLLKKRDELCKQIADMPAAKQVTAGLHVAAIAQKCVGQRKLIHLARRAPPERLSSLATLVRFLRL